LRELSSRQPVVIFDGPIIVELPDAMTQVGIEIAAREYGWEPGLKRYNSALDNVLED
jgi:hypothetical protein